MKFRLPDVFAVVSDLDRARQVSRFFCHVHHVLDELWLLQHCRAVAFFHHPPLRTAAVDVDAVALAVRGELRQ